jgi:Flp pilus assembly protein TadD
MIGPLALIVATVTTWLATREERERAVFTGLAGGLMAFLAFNAFFYAMAWSSEDYLWDHTLLSNHDAWQAHNRLGARKLGRGDVEGAHYHFRNSSRLRPDLGETKNNLAIVLMRKGRVDEAIQTYEEALKASPEIQKIRANLADAYLQAGRFAEARELYEQLLQLNPDNPLLRNKHGLTLFKLGEKEQAAAEFRRVLAIDPNFKEAAENLKVVLGQTDPAAAKPAPEPANQE